MRVAIRLAILAGLIGLVPGVAAHAAVRAADAAATRPCEPGRIDPPGDAASEACIIDEDVTGLAARLLVVKFGAGAPAFAKERVARYAAESDPESAALWRGIAATAATLLESH